MILLRLLWRNSHESGMVIPVLPDMETHEKPLKRPDNLFIREGLLIKDIKSLHWVVLLGSFIRRCALARSAAPPCCPEAELEVIIPMPRKAPDMMCCVVSGRPASVRRGHRGCLRIRKRFSDVQCDWTGDWDDF